MVAEAEDRPVTGDRLVRNIGLLTASQLITWTLTAGWTLFVPRLVGPAGIGLLVMAWAVSGIIGNLCSLGLPTLLVKEIAAAPERAPRVLGTALVIRLCCIAPALGFTVMYLRLGHFDGEKALVLFLAAGIAITWLFLDIQMAAFQGIERMEYLAYDSILNKGIFVLGSVALVVAGLGAVSLVSMTLIATLAVVVLNAIWSRRFFRVEWRTNLDQVRRLARASLPYWGLAVFLSIYQWIDSAMLAVMTRPEVVGWYGVPSRIFGSMLVIPIILYTAWLPKLVSAFTVSQDQLRRTARAPIEVVTSLSLPIGVGAALIAGPLITFLYGPAYAPSIPVFSVLAVTAIPMYLNITISQLLIASNRQATWMRALGAASIVNPVVNFFLIQVFQARFGNGALGAAFSLLITELLMASYGTFAIRKLVEPESLARLGRVALATAGMGATILLTSRLGLLVEVLGGSVSLLLFLVVLRVLTRAQVVDIFSDGLTRIRSRVSRPTAAPAVDAQADSPRTRHSVSS
jgi:O-antigen/teichoic acid export membrane protein